MKKTGREDQWNRLVGGYTKKLIRHPEQIEKTLMDYPETIRRILYTNAQEDSLISYGQKWGDFMSLPLVNLARRQQKIGHEVVESILSGDPLQLEAVLKAAGRRRSVRNALKVGVWQDLINRSVRMERGQLVAQPGAALGTVRRLKESGQLGRIFNKDEIKRFDLLEQHLSWLPSDAGVGESLQAAEIATGMIPYSPHKIPKAIQSGLLVARNAAFARVFMDDKASKILVDHAARMARGGDPGWLPGARAIAVALGNVVADAKSDAAEIDKLFPQMDPALDIDYFPSLIEGGGPVSPDPMFLESMERPPPIPRGTPIFGP
jgi:hypothetical protein